MTAAVIHAVLNALSIAGVNAVARFPDAGLDRKAAVVAVGVRSGTLESPGYGSYLGEQLENGEWTELYGWKTQVTVLLDLYVPAGQADACETLFSAVGGALHGLPSGLRPQRLTRGELAPDRDTGMFRCPCTLECAAFFTRTAREEGTVWSDFVFRGEITSNERE